MVISFLFCMRTSEARCLRHCDLILGENGEAVLTIFFQRSKTGQTAIGCFRSLNETRSFLRPIVAVVPWLRAIDWGPRGKQKVFSDDAPKGLSSLIKWSVAARGLPPERFATHSLRSGGASAMFVAGVNFHDVKRFGRRASNTVKIYLFHDDATYQGVGRKWSHQKGY